MENLKEAEKRLKELEQITSLNQHPLVQADFNRTVILGIERDRLLKELDKARTRLVDLEQQAAEAVADGKAFPAEEIDKAQAAVGKLEARARVLCDACEKSQAKAEEAKQQAAKAMQAEFAELLGAILPELNRLLEAARVPNELARRVYALGNRLPHNPVSPSFFWCELLTNTGNACRLASWRAYIKLAGIKL